MINTKDFMICVPERKIVKVEERLERLLVPGGCMMVNKEVCEDSVFRVNLTEEEVVRSSTYRELRGIEEGIEAWAGRLEARA